ncbi:MAG: hypothetical protein WDM80_00190 [Limisphaerales bacterium]
MKINFLQMAALASVALPLAAAPLNESTFTEVINSVEVNRRCWQDGDAGTSQRTFQGARPRAHGASSRAELTAPDQTITRVGANTVFSLNPPDVT